MSWKEPPAEKNVAAVLTIQSALLPGDPRGSGIDNPLGVEGLEPVLDPSDPIVFAPYFAVLFASAVSLVVRFRRSAGVERQQIKWLCCSGSSWSSPVRSPPSRWSHPLL